MQMHSAITLKRICEAVERRNSSLDDPGFCIACGHEVLGVEPDACAVECEHCGDETVFGAEELLLSHGEA